jgi:hypothetical protein
VALVLASVFEKNMTFHVKEEALLESSLLYIGHRKKSESRAFPTPKIV